MAGKFFARPKLLVVFVVIIIVIAGVVWFASIIVIHHQILYLKLSQCLKVRQL